MFDEMLKSIQSGFSRIATPQRLFVLIIFLVLAWLLMSYSDGKSFSMDSMGTGTDTDAAPAAPGAPAAGAGGVVDISMPSDSNARPIANPNDLLVKDENSEWAKINNMGNVLNADLLEAGYHIGLNSIGSTMKNANLQLRSDPIIPKQDVGPWNQSTYEPDFGRVPLEVGYGPATK